MNASVVGLLIAAGIFAVSIAVVGVIGYTIYRRVSRTVQSYSRMIFGTNNPVEGMKKVELENANTPKSVSSDTNLYLPQIMRDFPEFHYDEMKTRAENVLTSYLRGIDGMNASLLEE